MYFSAVLLYSQSTEIRHVLLVVTELLKYTGKGLLLSIFGNNHLHKHPWNVQHQTLIEQ